LSLNRFNRFDKRRGKAILRKTLTFPDAY
jgi:hypothetical protein